MNCKPGDLAFVVGCARNQEWTLGKIVTVLRAHDFYPGWLIELDGEPKWHAYDEHLRPIRPGETPEESIESMRKLTETKKGVAA